MKCKNCQWFKMEKLPDHMTTTRGQGTCHLNPPSDNGLVFVYADCFCSHYEDRNCNEIADPIPDGVKRQVMLMKNQLLNGHPVLPFAENINALSVLCEDEETPEDTTASNSET